MTYVIRSTNFSDVAALPTIERSASRVFQSISALAWVADFPVMTIDAHEAFIHQDLSWIAEDTSSKKIAGFIVAKRIHKNLHIEEVSVGEAYQKQGIGLKLFQTAFAKAVSLGVRNVTLTTFRDVPWNAPYYGRLGFDVIPTTDLPQYLETKLQNEADGGFPRDLRCAMQKSSQSV